MDIKYNVIKIKENKKEEVKDHVDGVKGKNIYLTIDTKILF